MAWGDTVVNISIPGKKEIQVSELENIVLLLITAVNEIQKKDFIAKPLGSHADLREQRMRNEMHSKDIDVRLKAISKELFNLQNLLQKS